MQERSLRNGTGSKTRWYPIPINVWEQALSSLSLNGQALIPDYNVRRNLAYGLQYLEYLQQTLIELSLSAVLEKMTYKSYIITAVGIVEAFLYHAVRASGGNEDKLYKIIGHLEDNQALGVRPETYQDLHIFRKLRNKVHIYELRDDVGNDYAVFSEAEFNEMRAIIGEIVLGSSISGGDDVVSCFSFLDPELFKTPVFDDVFL